MDAAQLANLAGSALLLLTAVVAAVVYCAKADWWRSAWGWNVMIVTVSIGLLGLYTLVVTLIWPAGPVTAALRVARTVLQVILSAALVQRTHLMLEAQARSRQPDPSKK
ncbi:hypothetical protein KCMC57_64080 (plasmid) [Kitasatospora sp. CMC57]|uniref:DUF2304 domain-containing protein n=1 Tax=Kitasatospora sp. CMC57 TaxID=3231513 RepID=A0AB33KB69_9ACTN